MKSTLILAIALTFNSILLIMVATSSCGSMDATELERIRAVTCPSVCAAYADAVDAGVEVSPEDVALMEVCKCGPQ